MIARPPEFFAGRPSAITTEKGIPMSSYPPPPVYRSSPSQPAGEPPLWAPWYGISFGAAVRRFFQKYADFSGRASRSEFWWAVLGYAIVSIVLSSVSTAVGGGGHASTDAAGTVTTTPPTPAGILLIVVSGIFGLGILVPALALYWRRLHDTNLSGGFWFLGFVPLVGGIIVLVLVLRGSDPAGQRFDRPRT